MIIHHIKEKGKPVGCMLAIANDSEFFIGVSKCSSHDTYNKNIGIEIALGRVKKCMETNKSNLYRVPISWYKKYLEFYERCSRYYKDKNASSHCSSCVNIISKITNKKK